MKLLTFFLFLGAFTLQSFANVYLVKNLNLPRISGPRFFFATEGRVLLTIFGTLLFIYLLSGLWSWHLVILFLVISQLAVILGTVLNAALGSSSEKSRSRISAAMGEIGLNHPIIYTLSNFLAGFTLLGFLVAAAVAHFRYAWGSQPLYIAAVKYTLIGMIFVPNIQIWGRMAAILSSEDLDEDTRQQVLINQLADLLSYAIFISLALWAFGVGAGPLPATLATVANTFSARVSIVVLAFPMLLFMLPYWIGTQRGSRFRSKLVSKRRDFTATLADILKTPLAASYIPAISNLHTQVRVELTDTMQSSEIMKFHPANLDNPPPALTYSKPFVEASQDLDPRFRHVDELIKFDSELQQITADLTAQPPLRVIRAAERWSKKYEIRKKELGIEIKSSSNTRPVVLLAVGTLLSALISSILSDVGKTAWSAIASGTTHK
jgi:hypothetical protein